MDSVYLYPSFSGEFSTVIGEILISEINGIYLFMKRTIRIVVKTVPVRRFATEISKYLAIIQLR
jgi:hypothetical protein